MRYHSGLLASRFDADRASDPATETRRYTERASCVGRLHDEELQTMRFGTTLAVGALALLTSGCGTPAPTAIPQTPAAPKTAGSPIDPDKYYAVLLNNGTVFFGKLEGYGTPYPTLRDVFYVRRALNPKTKTLSNVLTRRGQELHRPDVMILNPQAITLIEPVASGSTVAEMIEQARQK